ncbi:MAG: exosortase/archaeosortase family protein, partial [Bacteroidales bacterium]
MNRRRDFIGRMASGLREIWSAAGNVFLFILITLAFHFIWKIFQEQIEQAAVIVFLGDWFATRAYNVADWIQQHLLGMTYATADPNVFKFPGKGSIIINESCSGLKQFYQVLVLFLIFPGPWRHKAWFIPVSLLIMYWTNIFRVVMLSLVMAYIPQHWDFTHDWVLRPFFYVVLFALWIWWVE